MRPDLTGWERQFVRSVGEKKHLSPKQQALIAQLVAQYLNKFPSFEGNGIPNQRHSEHRNPSAAQPN